MMKKIIVLSTFICGFSAIYSQAQDCCDKVATQGVEIDKLKTQISNLQNDSINLRKKVINLQKDNEIPQKQIETLNKNAVKTERDNLQKQVYTLTADTAALHKKLSEKELHIAAAQREGDNQIKEAKEQGKVEVLSDIMNTYKQPFNDLIKFSSKQSVERDLLLVGNDEATRKKLQDLQKYFTAQQVLSEQYNEQKVRAAQTQIGALEQTELVKELAIKLEKYKLCNAGLKNSINEILKIDREFTANNENAKKSKMQDIAYVITRYLYDYPSFSFSNYPYLADIIWEICTKKQKNPDIDISDLLKKL